MMAVELRTPLFVTYDDYRVGVLLGDGLIRDVCTVRHEAVRATPDHPRQCLTDAVRTWSDIAAAVSATSGLAISEVTLRAPIPRPVNVFGAPVNYMEHQGELGEMRSPSKGTVKELGLFVKSVGSVSGPDSPIELPEMPGREVHYEGEIAVVIGIGGSDFDDEQAERAILGFTGSLDVTLRLEADHREERSMRKSYRTFTPTGPAVMPYRPGDLTGLGLALSINGEERQRGRLDELVMGVVDLVKLASTIVTLEPGDLILTGTPGGVGALGVGDRVDLAVDGLPLLSLDVVQRGGGR